MIAEDFMENNSLRRNITGLELTDYARLRILFPDVRPEYFADLLGLNAVAPCKKSIEGKTQVERLPFRLGFEQPLPDPDALEYPAVARNTPFPRLFGLQEHEQEREDTPPETYLNAKPYSEESRSDSETEIAPELLSNWNEIWPWLHRLFRMGKTTNRLDIDSIVKHAAQRKPLSAIPWEKKVRWPQQFVLLVDWSRHLTSFYHDYFHLIHNLHAWFSGRLQTVFCLDSPRQQFSFNGKVYDSFPDNIVSQRILYLGDLGFLDKSQLSTDVWYSLCRRLSENNCDLIALLTVNP